MCQIGKTAAVVFVIHGFLFKNLFKSKETVNLISQIFMPYGILHRKYLAINVIIITIEYQSISMHSTV